MLVSFRKLYCFAFLTIAFAWTVFLLPKLAQGISNNIANGGFRDELYKGFSKAFFLSNYCAVLWYTPKCNLIYAPERIAAIGI
jgi:hypothetical protein